MSSWWLTDEYDETEVALPPEFYDHTYDGNPLLSPALVKVFPKPDRDPLTQQGWGLKGPKDKDNPGQRLEGFMPRYLRGEFLPRKALARYESRGDPFAIVMRSVSMICVDIDGKNGGLEHANELGLTIPTMAETSKSGNGFHLFYATGEDWDEEKGFGKFADAIGIVQGVDIRATGCVYHYPTQRWNDRPLTKIPPFLEKLLTEREQKRQVAAARITSIINTTDETEVLMLHHELTTELAKSIPAGKRNTTLFAIGSKMKMADVPDWDQKVLARADEVGLDADEASKIVANIESYAA